MGIVDKIFTRVGASDNISMGESTFMVEMNESASILNNISESSLVLLDEIGRGTSTYDGISIAWAIAEYLHEHPSQPKTLFATHYHELNEMTQPLSALKTLMFLLRRLKTVYCFYANLSQGEVPIVLEFMLLKWQGCPSMFSLCKENLKNLEKSHHEETKRALKNKKLKYS